MLAIDGVKVAKSGPCPERYTKKVVDAYYAALKRCSVLATICKGAAEKIRIIRGLESRERRQYRTQGRKPENLPRHSES